MINVTAVGSWALVDLAGEFDVVNAEGIRSVAVDLIGQAQLPAGPRGWPSDAAGENGAPAGRRAPPARHRGPSPSDQFRAQGLIPPWALRPCGGHR
jgi:hypothetical protein